MMETAQSNGCCGGTAKVAVTQNDDQGNLFWEIVTAE